MKKLWPVRRSLSSSFWPKVETIWQKDALGVCVSTFVCLRCEAIVCVCVRLLVFIWRCTCSHLAGHHFPFWISYPFCCNAEAAFSVYSCVIGMLQISKCAGCAYPVATLQFSTKNGYSYPPISDHLPRLNDVVEWLVTTWCPVKEFIPLFKILHYLSFAGHPLFQSGMAFFCKGSVHICLYQ